MNSEFFEALAQLEKERGLPENYLLEKIEAALILAVKKGYNVDDENVSVEIDPAEGKFSVCLLKEVVEEVFDPNIEVTIPQARLKKKDALPPQDKGIRPHRGADREARHPPGPQGG